MSDSVFDLSEEQLWQLENGRELVLETGKQKVRLRGENYYD